MFEAAIRMPTVDPAAESGLRAIDWAEIVARLGAARDLRTVLGRAPGAGGGFVPDAAAGIARHALGERSINLGALAAGKWPDSTLAAAAPWADHRERDK